MNLRSPSSTTTSISLTWDASTDNIGVTGYEVYRNGTYLSTVTTTQCTDMGLALNTSNTYTIQAIDAAGNRSRDSNSIQAKTTFVDNQPPSMPTDMKQTDIGKNSVSLSWTASTDNIGVTGYEVYRDNTYVTTTTNPSFTQTGLATNASYSYTIRAKDAAGNKSPSSTALSVETKPDWYQYSVVDANGKTVDVYLSDLDQQASSFRVILKKSSETQYRQLVQNNGVWSSGTMYAYDPIFGSNGTAYAKAGLVNVQIRSLNQLIDKKKNELLASFYSTVGINPSSLTSEDRSMIVLGITASIDDNLFFGLAQYLNNNPNYEDNYYYMQAKVYMDAAFVAYFTFQTAESLAAANNFFKSAGVTFRMIRAIGRNQITLGTLSIVTVGQLAVAGELLSFAGISSIMTARSMSISHSDDLKLQRTVGYKIKLNSDALKKMDYGIRDIPILNKFKKISTAEELNAFWKSKGYFNPPYQPGTPVYQFKLERNTKFVRMHNNPDPDSKEGGQFLAKIEDIQDSQGNYLSAAELKDKYALQELPKYVQEVEIPAGTVMNCGIANEIKGWGNGGGLQFDLNYVRTGAFEPMRGVILK